MKIRIFPALTVRSRHVKVTNSGALFGYALWNPGWRRDSCSDAECVQEHRNDAAWCAEGAPRVGGV